MENDEYVTMDEETENLALALTHLIKGVSPKTDCGVTYDIVAEFLVHFLHEPIHPLEAEQYGREIRLARGSRNKTTQ